MTRGALIFALNNEAIDYMAMAEWSAQNIERHLGIPTHIVTDKDVAATQGNTRWFSDFARSATWHNLSRADAYDLSPWDQTLLLDADYVVASDQLGVLLDSDQDFLAHRWAHDVTNENNFTGLNYFGQYRMPQWWATVVMFKRSTHARLIFESMRMIKAHWGHYKKLYNARSPIYRNDYALSIALGIVDGHQLQHADIPWSLASVLNDSRLSRIEQDHYRVDWVTDEGKPRYVLLKNQDFHAMGKRDLGAIIES
jgi:hypothetical protein